MIDESDDRWMKNEDRWIIDRWCQRMKYFMMYEGEMYARWMNDDIIWCMLDEWMKEDWVIEDRCMISDDDIIWCMKDEWCMM